MIQVLAYDPNDGYVFFREDGRFYLARPPYRVYESTEDDIAERLVIRSDYHAGGADDVFVDRKAMLAWIRAKIQQSAAASPLSRPLSSEELFSSMLEHAPLYIIERYLNRIDEELIPSGERERAMKILGLIASQRERLPMQLTERLDALLQKVERIPAASEKIVADDGVTSPDSAG